MGRAMKGFSAAAGGGWWRPPRGVLRLWTRDRTRSRLR